eukprot:365312_1
MDFGDDSIAYSTTSIGNASTGATLNTSTMQSTLSLVKEEVNTSLTMHSEQEEDEDEAKRQTKRPGMRPGMKPYKKTNMPKHSMERLKAVWLTDKTPPFKSAYQVGQQIGEAGQFGKAYRCKRKKDKKIFVVKCISKSRFYRLDRSVQRRQALYIAMQGEIDI